MICLGCQTAKEFTLCLDCCPTLEELCAQCHGRPRYLIRLLDGTHKLGRLCYRCIFGPVITVVWKSNEDLLAIARATRKALN